MLFYRNTTALSVFHLAGEFTRWRLRMLVRRPHQSRDRKRAVMYAANTAAVIGRSSGNGVKYCGGVRPVFRICAVEYSLGPAMD